MRVLHICQRDDPDTGGSLSVATTLLRQQRASGLDVWILFLYGPPGTMSKDYAPGVECLGIDSSREAVRGIFALVRAVKRIQPNIIHSHDGILWPRLAFMILRIPIVMHSHLPVDSAPGIKDTVGKIMVKATTRQLIGISLHTIETWVRDGYPPSRIHYVPNGVDYERFTISDATGKRALRRRLGLSEDRHVLLWVGRLHRDVKGTDRVERIARLLPAETVLVVVGNGPEFEAMHGRCKDLIDRGAMVMAGSVGRPEEYYKAADSYLFTSYREAFGLVILEAAFCGLPIIAFPVTEGGGAVGLLNEFKVTLLDDSESDEWLFAQVERVVDGAGMCPENRQAAVSKYSLQAVSKKVVEVYDICLAGKA